jgi:tetratricopeptide (TPR) repeat protein
VAEELGDLPLALTQAAAYVEATGCSLGRYLELFRGVRARLLRKGQPPEDYPHTVATTWSLVYDRVQGASPAAAELLSLLAFLDPGRVPLRLVREQAEHLPEMLAKTAADPLGLEEALSLLRRHALVEREGERLLVHRLVQMVVREHLGQEDSRYMAARAVAVVNAAFPFEWNDLATWAPSGEMLPHAFTATVHAAELDADTLEAAHLLHRAGLYLLRHGLLAEARQALERALEIKRKVLGTEEHPSAASSLAVLATVLEAQGELAGARRDLVRSLEIQRKVLGTEEHPSVASSLHELARVLQAQGELAEARRHLERSLEIKRKVLGTEEHSSVAASLHTLAIVLEGQGELAGARRHLEHSMEIKRKVLGTEEHPSVAASLHTLAGVLRAQGELAEARRHLERSLTIQATVYGTREHYNTAIAEASLGCLLLETGEREAGLEFLRHALAVFRKQLGLEHPRTRNLAAILQSQGITP